MKLDRFSSRKRPVASADLLPRAEPGESTESDLFDIQRDVTPEDWKLIRRIVEGQARVGVRIHKHIQGLLLLGDENKSGLNMEDMRLVALGSLRGSNLAGTDGAEVIVSRCILAPEERPQLRGLMSQDQIDALWVRVKDGNAASPALREALALFLLFPDMRQEVVAHFNPSGLMRKLRQTIRELGPHEYTYFVGTVLPILFPGDYSGELPQNFFSKAKQGQTQHGKLVIEPAVMAHFMTAGKVEVRADGKIIAHRKVGPQRPVDLPDRNIL